MAVIKIRCAIPTNIQIGENMLTLRFCRLNIIFVMAIIVIIGCNRNENQIHKMNLKQRYDIHKVVLGTFKTQKEKPFGIPGSDGVLWMTMGRGGVTIDDNGKIYVLSGTKILIYKDDGKLSREIILRDIDSDYRAMALEVSNDGSRLYIRLEKNDEAKYYVFDKDGAFIESKKDVGYLKRSCQDIFSAEKYGIVENAIVKTGLYVLDSKLNLIKDLKEYYLLDVRLNERPVGFFDKEFNYYFMRYWPFVIKIDTAGKVVWKKKVVFQGDNWRLIGIDKDANLYALVVTGNGNSIVIINNELNVLASVSLEALTKNIENVDSMAVENFLVTCDGTIYFIPSYVDSVNPAFEYAYREYLKRGEYAIYKIAQIK